MHNSEILKTLSERMKVYHGDRENGESVTINGKPLNPRIDLENHSPDGFNWGYAGSGPAQLALAILADYLDSDKAALFFYQAFKERVIQHIKENEFVITGKQIDGFLRQYSDYLKLNEIENVEKK